MTIQIRTFDSTQPDFRQQLAHVLAFEAAEDDAIDRAAATILAAVKQRGDAAVLEYTNKFDRLQASDVAALEIPRAELLAALDGLPATRRDALQTAAGRVRAYHERQKIECGSAGFSYTEADGTVLGQKVTPLDRVGIYVPGGKAAYPSSVLMNAIPAKVAGVAEVIMVVPTPDGVKNELVLAAAAIAGVDRVFTIGGAQAVGALAYGTDTVPAVDKIVGPGNAYVAAAKRRVFGTVGIDMIAGPSEILVLCDGSTDPDWIAMDLFSQAEHDELAQSILLCPDAAYLARVQASIDRLIGDMPRQDTIRTSLRQPRRAGQGARHGRSLRDRQFHRRRTPGNFRCRAAALGRSHPPCRRHVPRPLFFGIAGRLLRRPQPRAADFAHRALFLAAGGI